MSLESNGSQVPNGEFKQNGTSKDGIRSSENNAGHWVGWHLYGLAYTCLFYFPSFPGLPDNVCASLGHHWAHHLLLHQQHGSRRNSGHVSTWCLRLLARGKIPSPLSSLFSFSPFLPSWELAFSSIQFLSSFLQAAKLANYAKYQRLCDTLFVIFSAVFMVTRLGIYPFW